MYKQIYYMIFYLLLKNIIFYQYNNFITESYLSMDSTIFENNLYLNDVLKLETSQEYKTIGKKNQTTLILLLNFS